MSEKVDHDQAARNAELEQIVRDARQARARLLDLVSYLDDFLAVAEHYPDELPAAAKFVHEPIELAQLVWDHHLGVKGKHATVSHRVWRTIELLEKGRDALDHPHTRCIPSQELEAALLRGESPAREQPLTREEAIAFAVEVVVVLASGDRDGLSRITADEWRSALLRWRGFVEGTAGCELNGGRPYSWHSVVFDLLKPHGITSSSESRALINLMKDAGHRAAPKT